MKLTVSVLLILLFLSPLIILIGAGTGLQFPTDVWIVFAITVFQAGCSASLSLLLGFAGAYGLEAAGRRFGVANGRLLEALSLLPNVAPVLLFLLGVMKFMPWARGLSGVILVHALLNTGLVATSLLRLFREKVSTFADLAHVEGSSRTTFFVRVALPVLVPDLRLIFVFVFAICFSSLAVPLVLGGSRATTLEVLIWQVLRIDGDFARAFGLALLQLASILALTFALRHRGQRASPSASFGALRTSQPLLANLWGLPFVLLPSLLLIATLLDRPWIGASRFFELNGLATEVVRGFLGSLLVSVGTGVTVAVILLAIAFVDPRGFWRKVLLGYVAPSSVITGFAFLIVWRAQGLATYFKIFLALALVSAPAFYRLYWDAALSGLRAQRTVAFSLGASSGMTFRRVILPQLIRPVCFVAGLSSLWAWGDFALSRVIAERDMTLGMTVQSLMSSYRFEIATFLVWILLFGGAATFFFFASIPSLLGVDRVVGQKSQS